MAPHTPPEPTAAPVPPSSGERGPSPRAGKKKPAKTVTAGRQATLVECMEMQKKHAAMSRKG